MQLVERRAIGSSPRSLGLLLNEAIRDDDAHARIDPPTHQITTSTPTSTDSRTPEATLREFSKFGVENSNFEDRDSPHRSRTRTAANDSGALRLTR